MFSVDAVDLARIQFAASITFHILFPTITIALAWVLLFFKLRWRATGNAAWQDAYRFWVGIFALSFAMGAVSGVAMSFQFGSNWPGYMARVGNIAGPLLAYEVLTALLLEASCLGVMLFGPGRVSERLHTAATAAVAVGTTLSAFWILALGSWMQTPAGYRILDGIVLPVDWIEIIFNPSFPYRFAHMMLASGLTAAFLLAGVSAFQGLRRSWSDGERKTLVAGVVLAAILIPVQILAGHLHKLNTLAHQPAKVAAIEGLWETRSRAPLLLFALPDERARSNRHEWGVPDLASLLLTRTPDGEVRGLNEFGDRHPPVAKVFWSFRIMVAVGLLMLVTAWLSLALLRWRRGRPDPLPRWLMRWLAGMTFSGWIATVAGWWVAEIGRQPDLVTGLLTTAEAAASHPVPVVGFSLAGYVLVYAFLILAYVGVVAYMADRGTAPGGRGGAEDRDRAETAPGLAPGTDGPAAAPQPAGA